MQWSSTRDNGTSSPRVIWPIDFNWDCHPGHTKTVPMPPKPKQRRTPRVHQIVMIPFFGYPSLPIASIRLVYIYLLLDPHKRKKTVAKFMYSVNIQGTFCFPMDGSWVNIIFSRGNEPFTPHARVASGFPYLGFFFNERRAKRRIPPTWNSGLNTPNPIISRDHS